MTGRRTGGTPPQSLNRRLGGCSLPGLQTLARGPASLFAFCAWQAGDGAPANVALDRALANNPRYSMALLLREALDSGAPPSMARLPMSPEEVAAAYDAAERAEDEAAR